MTSVLILIVSALGLLYLLLSFAHARVMHADMQELNRLHEAGVFEPTDSVMQDFRTVSELVDSVAPAIYMRQELWIRLYFLALSAGRALGGGQGVEREIMRLAAYQAQHYRLACTRLAAIR